MYVYMPSINSSGIPGWSSDTIVTLVSTDTLTREVTSIHWYPWMVQGYQSNYGIHGYSEKHGRPV